MLSEHRLYLQVKKNTQLITQISNNLPADYTNKNEIIINQHTREILIIGMTTNMS